VKLPSWLLCSHNILYQNVFVEIYRKEPINVGAMLASHEKMNEARSLVRVSYLALAKCTRKLLHKHQNPSVQGGRALSEGFCDH
jgi:hypothetical protein